ncbi:MAG TPA: 30S ribosomal protein S12 methylthiotransferase RimO [candidate division Zixibacteria bacterium]|nr:30S ribosomal protein S12 methylthiotransferase RimO [candidate division Zixibacteria bacterium]
MATGEKSKTYFLATLGCPKNEVDSEALEVALLSAGLLRADDSRSADLILVNSCGFINDAKVETIQTVLDLHQDRKEGSVLVMCGCLPARYNLTRSLDEVDIFLPWNKHHELISKLRDLGWPVNRPATGGQSVPSIKRIKPASAFSYLRISEGCDNRCAYCAIPDIKGPFKSNSFQEIVDEAEYLCQNGVRELILIGQDTTLYGKNGPEETSLTALLKALSVDTSCDWIRLMYAHPAHLTDETISVMATTDKIVKYIDLPLQHINDRLLKRMNRKVTRKQVESLIAKLRERIPNLVLRTTFIVGFPGETDQDFAELLDFCETAKFDNVGIFKYSPEEGTPAYSFKGRVIEETIDERYLTLLDIQNMISYEILNRRLGNTEKVLLHEIDSKGVGYGRTWFQAPEVDGQVIVEGCKSQPGEFVDVLVERSDAYDLFAKER